MITTGNKQEQAFIAELTKQFTYLFATDAAYKIVAEKNLPQDLTRKIIDAWPNVELAGEAMKATIKALELKPTYKAVDVFLRGEA